MRVLFCVRHNFYDAPGGAQIQILKTKEYLEKLGVSCELTTTPYRVDFNKYDILHLTDLTWVYDNIIYIREIKKQDFKGKKVLSTIYWPFDDYASKGAPFLQKVIFKLFGIGGFERLKAIGKYIYKKEKIYIEGIFNSYISNQKKIIDSVDFFLPNSEMEMDALNKRLGLNLKNYTIANNAIDVSVFDEVIAKNKKKKNPKMIVFVARIDARKNQLNFLKAIYNTDYKVFFIGNPGPNSHSYYQNLKKLAQKRGNVEFISHISQKEVFSYMLKAKVSVLTSWIETPGLVSIEAAYAGCNLVIAEKGSVKEYFRNFAFYCKPDDLISIKEAVNKAINSKFNPSFIEIIKKEYSWETTASQTLSAYKKVLKSE